MRETMAAALVRLAGWCATALLLAIILYLTRESGGMLNRDLVLGPAWDPVADPPRFGALPLLAGTLWVTLGAAALAGPVGVAAALWLAEAAPPDAAAAVRGTLELLAAMPSVIIGFVGLVAVAPWVQRTFALPTGYTALTGSLLLAWMALPTIVTLGADALAAVPARYREASAGLGATPWETLTRAVLPAAGPGLAAACTLGLGRVVGETMVVLMVTGNVPVAAASPLQPVQTLTATVAAEMGEAVQGSIHYRALFALGLLLLAVNLGLSWMAAGLAGPHRQG